MLLQLANIFTSNLAKHNLTEMGLFTLVQLLCLMFIELVKFRT